MVSLLHPQLPESLAALEDIALDLRWTWNHETDALWTQIDRNLWQRTGNPWTMLQEMPPGRLMELAADKDFLATLQAFVAQRRQYLERKTWFEDAYGASSLGPIAYFSMEFGLGAALPLYAGGLGVLAGDVLKTASDLGIPVIGIGLLYQEGYFRQMLDAEGVQREVYPYNDPAMMPIRPAILPDNGWLRIVLELPGRVIELRVWEVTVGRVKLYLLDSNSPLNNPVDRGITGKLYSGGSEIRLMQEIILGVGGWRVIEALGHNVEVCHINEGHAAFAIIERANQLALRQKIGFWEALWATRAGNVFTTHTPVEAGFDRFHPDLLRKYLPYVRGKLSGKTVSLTDVLALGRVHPQDESEPFNMTYLALRGSALCFGVSRLHGAFSRRIFEPLFPRWPRSEIPVGHITNGVHIPTWDSIGADRMWTEACGKERWQVMPDGIFDNIQKVPDEELWAIRAEGRQRIIRVAREHLAMQLQARGLESEAVDDVTGVLDPNILTLGFARRFTEYKRPNLLLSDTDRLTRLLLDPKTPIQIVAAGKAHPADLTGKAMIRDWLKFAQDPRFRHRVVFIEDYDIAIAQELVQGVDVWINTPRRPWEACGTSGMKVLVNGGLNCSVRDGWWDEAYAEDLGWAIGDGQDGENAQGDARDAQDLYDTLERHIIPAFYDRDAAGLPRAWLTRQRRSMAVLTPAFSSTRMMRQYIEEAYLSRANAFRARLADGCAIAKELNGWARHLYLHWSSLHVAEPSFERTGESWNVSVPVLLGEIPPGSVRVELFADAIDKWNETTVFLSKTSAIPGAVNGYIFNGRLPASRPAQHFTIRVVPYHPNAFIPKEFPLIAWQR